MLPGSSFEVCVIAQDVSHGAAICAYLEANGMRVSQLPELSELANGDAGAYSPSLLIADADSFGRLRSRGSLRLLRAVATIPVILMSDTALEIDRVVGLEGGADDFVAKSIPPRELLARVRAVLRRAYGEPMTVRELGATVPIGDFTFSTSLRELVRGEQTVVLGRVQAAVLAELCRRPGVAVSRARLGAVAGSMGGRHGSRAIDATIRRLRKLIEVQPNAPRLILTVQGAGYVLALSS